MNLCWILSKADNEKDQFSTEPSLRILQELLRHLFKKKQQQKRKALVQNNSQHEI